MRGGCSDFARETVSFPFVTFNFPTERSGFPLEVLGEADCVGFGADVFFPPRLEKFHFWPSSDFIRLICGWSKVNSVTLSVFEKISGINSTPTLSDFACTKGDWLN